MRGRRSPKCRRNCSAGYGRRLPWLSSLGASITGEVIGCQSFGVFISVDDVLDAMALAEITAMPTGMGLPALGARVFGEAICIPNTTIR